MECTIQITVKLHPANNTDTSVITGPSTATVGPKGDILTGPLWGKIFKVFFLK